MSESLNILIVDDDEYIREMLVLLLESKGIENIETAGNGAEGFAKLQAATSPRVIFLDLMMPICSGWDFLKLFEAHPELKGHRVVVMSATRPESSELGSYDFFQKPLEIDQVFKFLDSVRVQ